MVISLQIIHLYKYIVNNRIHLYNNRFTLIIQGYKVGDYVPKISEARKQANKKWNDKNLSTKYDHIHLALPAGYKERLKTAAGKESVNEYIRKAIDQRMEMEKQDE